jgi:geranylgeranyl diphosphate synthase, type II
MPPLSPSQFKSHVDQRVAQIEQAMNEFLEPLLLRTPPRLRESIRYSLFAGGKRLRPMLVLEWHQLASNQAQPDDTALAAAVAIECIHTFSLVHDDLPAMDDDDLRRGKPTNHVVFGEAMAILAGDALTTLAFDLIARVAAPDVAGRLVIELAHASGPNGMIGGQVIDIESESKQLSLDSLQQLHAMKTGALITAACRMGAIASFSDSSLLDAATTYGKHLGLAFQIVDDVLDATSDDATLGKTAGKDAAQGKNTYPALLGLEASNQLARQQVEQAIAALAPFGDRAAVLRAAADFVIQRDR